MAQQSTSSIILSFLIKISDPCMNFGSHLLLKSPQAHCSNHTCLCPTSGPPSRLSEGLFPQMLPRHLLPLVSAYRSPPPIIYFYLLQGIYYYSNLHCFPYLLSVVNDLYQNKACVPFTAAASMAEFVFIVLTRSLHYFHNIFIHKV